MDDFSFDALNQTFSHLSFEHVAPLLGDATFQTHIVPLSREAAVELLSLCRAVRSKGSPPPASSAEDALQQSLAPFPHLVALAGQLDAAIAAHFPDCEGVFAKLADFSPKDAVGDSGDDPRFAALYRAKLDLLTAASPPNRDDNLALQALLWAKAGQLHQRSGAAVIGTFARSERITDELERKLEFCSSGYQPTHVALRQWVDLNPAFEFRGFSVGNRLAGMSQMATMGVGPLAYPQVIAQREALAASAQLFYEQRLKEPLAELSRLLGGLLVCDLYYHCPTDKWYVVELNPWETSAAGHLFSADMAALASGTMPFELRLHASTPSGLFEEAEFPQSWIRLLKESNDTWFDTKKII